MAALIMLASFITLALAVPAALAAPTIDGNLTDLIDYGTTLKNSGTGFGVAITDKPDVNGLPQVETIYSDPIFIPCPLLGGSPPALLSHWVNGIEIFSHYLDYVPGTTRLYLGLRSEGFIGDADGDNDPDGSGAGAALCNPNDNIEDFVGIGGTEIYAWSFDLNCDGRIDASLQVADNRVVGAGAFAGVTGTIAFRRDAGVGATGHDLEVEVNLPAPLPAAFKYVRVEANAFDGLTEDRSNGVVLVGTPKLVVAKSATPTSICVGGRTRFTIDVSNPGQTPLSVVVTDILPASLTYANNLNSSCNVGPPADNGGRLTFPSIDLAPGASCSISFDAQAGTACFGTVTNTVDAVGTFRSACIAEGSQSTLASATATVTCVSLPCVQVKASGPAAACPGEKITIQGTATNCSGDPETIVVRVGGIQAYNDVVPANSSVDWHISMLVPADCGVVSGTSGPTYGVEATATSACGQATAETSVFVRCENRPCVEAGASCEPALACPGTPIRVTGSARNCGLDSEDITIVIEGQSQSFHDVPAGETVSWIRTILLRECTSGDQVPFEVSATASSACGSPQSATASCSVGCLRPRVEVAKEVDPSGAVDEATTLHYTITVANPSTNVPLQNVVVTDPLCGEVTFQGNAVPAPSSGPAVGSGGTLVWNLGTVPAGGSVVLRFDALVRSLSNPACEAADRSCNNAVVVTGNCADAQARAEASVTTGINPCVAAGLCRITGGGCLNEDGGNRSHKQNTFGGNASPEHSGGGPTGNEWQHIHRDGRTILFNWHSHDAHVIACSVVPPGPCSPHAINTRADFVGTGQYSIGTGGRDTDGNMVAYIIDHKEGSCNKGTRDEYSIVVRTGLSIGQGEVVFTCAGFIDCGNLQIHETPAHIFGNGIALQGGEAGATGVTLLDRAYPNPFSGSTTFAYRVADGGAPVAVGVYNVAGRLVKSLAAGLKPAGTYTLTWDGSDDFGVRMAPGVYFLKSRVGTESTFSRVIYVAR